MTEQEKITLEHIAPYLPYGLKYATLSDDDDKYYIKRNYNTIGFGVHQSNVTNICLTEYSRPIYKICLRPLSDLTKPIKVDGYNDGKEFVPMYELCVKYACRIPENPEYGTYLLGEKNKVNYKWFFSFDNDNICFELRDNNKEFTVHSLPQYELIQQLYKWHFDIHGLIGQGLAIDINTLKNNTL